MAAQFITAIPAVVIASGNDTFVAVDVYVYALAIEDELSLSTVMITSAVD